MKHSKYVWMIGLGVTLLIIALPILLFTDRETAQARSAWDSVSTRPAKVSHAALINTPFKTGQEVTANCLTCHPNAANEVSHTAHFTWKSAPVYDAQHDKAISIGKANILNNFCIGIQSNWPGCTRCHAGYGWQDASYDFNAANVDCLVCHDQSGGYVKSTAGNPDKSVDLLAAARSVDTPTRQNCGSCHFNGGGGNGVKHGDLDETLYFPTDNLDVHMGRYNLQCVDCHKTENHEIAGRLITVSPDNANQVYCTDCHDKSTTHPDSRITAHLDTVACQTCHIPTVAKKDPTKVEWDWSQAGQDRPESQHTYLKIKGAFVYKSNLEPTYTWFNGYSDHYLLGDSINPAQVTVLDQPHGSINDPLALIFPFKLHEAKQPYDTVNNYLLQPKTVGETGYWTTFDWQQSLKLGSEAVGLNYSGQYGFASTEMYMPIAHMVAPKEQVLQCTDCHGESGRMDWKALGYNGDPMIWGGRK